MEIGCQCSQVVLLIYQRKCRRSMKGRYRGEPTSPLDGIKIPSSCRGKGSVSVVEEVVSPAAEGQELGIRLKCTLEIES